MSTWVIILHSLKELDWIDHGNVKVFTTDEHSASIFFSHPSQKDEEKKKMLISNTNMHFSAMKYMCCSSSKATKAFHTRHTQNRSSY